MKAYAKTDIGNCREENQDSYWIGELGDDAIAIFCATEWADRMPADVPAQRLLIL